MRLIDADLLKAEYIVPSTTTNSPCWLYVSMKTINDAPTIDAVEVVRCKDCKWWDKVDNIDGVNYGTCERKCTAIRKDAFPNENWFCADGERKNDEDERYRVIDKDARKSI